MTNNREIAVVHGRDSEVNEAVFSFLRALDLHPLEWEELLIRSTSATPYTGHLIENLFEDVQAVVVIFSPDDEARLHPDLYSEKEKQHEKRYMCQARPNVLFEAGMAFGLYPDRTILVEAGELRPISDLVGRHTVHLGTEKAIIGFVNRLKTAGCPVNTDGSNWLKNQRFSSLASLQRTAVPISEIIEPIRLFPTNIWLNYWETGSKDEILLLASKQKQAFPVIAKTLQRDLSRSETKWSLYSRKDGPNAPLRIKGQVNLQSSGSSDLRLIKVQQRFVVDGRPISNPPDAGPFGFSVIPGQEFNITFEASIPDRQFSEGEFLYALHVIYEDDTKEKRELEVYWWYEFEEDKFFNNLNKVPYFDSIRKNLW